MALDPAGTPLLQLIRSRRCSDVVVTGSTMKYRYIIPRGRMHEPALDYHKPTKRGGRRRRGGADSVDRGQVGFMPFAD